MTDTEFIETIGQAAVKYYNKYKILPSLTIAQAILESGYGRTQLAEECHNYFGMKWVNGCNCGFKTYQTREQRADGTIYTINARFRKYDNVEDGIKGYYDFLQYDRYKNLKGVTDYKKVCNLIRQDGWATDINYTNKLIKLIEQYNLTKYNEMVMSKNDNEITNTISININGKEYTMNRILKDNKDFICLTDFKQAGFDVEYNNKIPSFDIRVVEDTFVIDEQDKKVHKILIQNENFIRLRDLENIINISYNTDNKKVKINKKE